MKIVITGLGKSGTTALFYLLKAALQPSYCLFEPNDWLKVARANAHHEDILLKQLLLDTLDIAAWNHCQFYEKKIYLVRDPRDRMISALLYSCAFHYLADQEPPMIAKVLDVFRQKEQKSADISILELCKLSNINLDRLLSRFSLALTFYQQNPDYFLVKYEDLVSRQLFHLESYLGFRLPPTIEIPDGLQRVVRTKQSGSWRLWFTAADIDYFKPILSPYMQAFQYDIEDWHIAPAEPIPPIHASEYILRVLNEKRLQNGLMSV